MKTGKRSKGNMKYLDKIHIRSDCVFGTVTNKLEQFFKEVRVILLVV